MMLYRGTLYLGLVLMFESQFLMRFVMSKGCLTGLHDHNVRVTELHYGLQVDRD